MCIEKNAYPKKEHFLFENNTTNRMLETILARKIHGIGAII